MFESYLKKLKPRKPLKGREAVDVLYQGIQTRPRPEDVAEIVLDVMSNKLSAGQVRLLEKVVKHSVAQNI